MPNRGPLVAGVAALLIAAGCRSQPGATGSAPASPAGPSAVAVGSPGSTDGCGSATTSIDFAPSTVATLVGYGWHFVVADVVGFEPAFFNTPDGQRPLGLGSGPRSPNPSSNAATLIYTPVSVDVDQVISGPSTSGPDRLLIDGGTVGCFTMRVDAAPRLTAGSRYVFVLAEALGPDGEHPLPQARAVFAWPVDASGTVTTPDGPMSIEQLTDVVRAAPASPPASLAAMRPCVPGEVAIGTVAWTGATAEMGGGFSLVDIGPTACQVGGRPTSVMILDPAGTPLDIKVEAFEPDFQVGLVLILPETGPVPSDALYPGQTGAQLFWTNWCGLWSRSGTLVVGMPGIGTLRAPIVNLSAPRCDTPGQPSVLQVGPVITPR